MPKLGELKTTPRVAMCRPIFLLTLKRKFTSSKSHVAGIEDEKTRYRETEIDKNADDLGRGGVALFIIVSVWPPGTSRFQPEQ